MFKKILMVLISCALCSSVLAASEADCGVESRSPREELRCSRLRWRLGVHLIACLLALCTTQITTDLEAMARVGIGGVISMEVDIQWITPELAMQKVVWTETTVESATPASIVLHQSKSERDYYRAVAVPSLREIGNFSCLHPEHAIM